jgi:hypothetical protein
VVDCLPYKVGKKIPDQMKVPPGAIPDSTVITFVYNKKGKEVEFTSDKFPDDFDDSLYHFVKRYDKLVRKGNAEPAIKDFALKTASGNDTTQAVINNEGYTVLVFIRDMPARGRSLRSDYGWLRDEFKGKKGALFIVTSQKEEVLQRLENKEFSVEPDILVCDFVAVKTASRNDITVFLIKGGTILKKWPYTNFDEARAEIEKLPAAPVQ